MQVRGIVISVELDVAVAKNGGGTYPGARLAYRDEAGVMKEKGFHNNTFKFNPVLKTQLSNLNTGQPFVMEMEKEGEFWNVKSILPESAVVAATAQAVTGGKTNTPAYTSPKSTYETPEERAKKQIYIVRQSSITASIVYLDLLKATKVDPLDVIQHAKVFEAYVFGKDFDDGTLAGMPNDTEGII